MRVPALDEPERAVVSGNEPAGLAGRVGPGMSDDLVAQRLRQNERTFCEIATRRRAERATGRIAQRPPAIAGMTMTSAPSATAVARPDPARASSSPT